MKDLVSVKADRRDDKIIFEMVENGTKRILEIALSRKSVKKFVEARTAIGIQRDKIAKHFAAKIYAQYLKRGGYPCATSELARMEELKAAAAEMLAEICGGAKDESSDI